MDDFLSNHVYSLIHWPFIAWAIVAMLVGQVSKTAIWTEKRARTKGKMQWLFWWAWKLLPLHPVVVGALIGLIWLNPEHADPAWPWPASVAYFALAGACSVFLYQVLKGAAKSRGIDLSLPGETIKPPPPDDDDTPTPSLKPTRK